MVASLRYLDDKTSFGIIATGTIMGIVITGSGSVLMYLTVYCLALTVYGFNLRILLLGFIVVLILSFIGIPVRFLEIINNVIDINSTDISLDWTAKVAAGRFIANYIWITDILNYPFGHGFGLDKQIAIDRLYELGINPNVMGAYAKYGEDGLPIMPRSYLAAAAAVYGIFGLACIIIFIFVFCRKNNVSDLPLFGVGLTYLLVVGFVGSPYGWIFLMLSVNRNMEFLLNVGNSDRRKVS